MPLAANWQPLDVGVGEDDVGGLTTELEHERREVGGAAAWRIAAVPGPPVKLILSMPVGDERFTGFGAARDDVHHAGRDPRFQAQRPKRLPEKGANSGGLMMTVQPAASAAATEAPYAAGTFHVRMMATTPFGSTCCSRKRQRREHCRVQLVDPARVVVEPFCRRGGQVRREVGGKAALARRDHAELGGALA